MKKWLEVSNRTDKEVAKLAAAQIITRVNHPSNVVQVGDQVYAPGVTKEDYGVGVIPMKIHSIEQLSSPAQNAVRQAVMSQYNIPDPKDEIKKSLQGSCPECHEEDGKLDTEKMSEGGSCVFGCGGKVDTDHGVCDKCKEPSANHFECEKCGSEYEDWGGKWEKTGGKKDEVKKAISTPKPLPIPGEGGDHVLSQAAKKVAQAVVQHAKQNMHAVSGSASGRVKKSIHDLYAHYAQQEWEKVLGAAQRYMRDMQGRGNPAPPTPTAVNESPVKLPKSPKMQKSLIPFKGAPLAAPSSQAAEHEGLFSDFAKFTDRHGQTEHPDLGKPVTHEVTAHHENSAIHLSSKTTFGKYGERRIAHEHQWYVPQGWAKAAGQLSHKESVDETQGSKTVRMNKEDTIPNISAMREHINSLYTHIKNAPPAPDIQKLDKAFAGSLEDLQKALGPIMPNARASAKVMSAFTSLAMRHKSEEHPELGTPDHELHHMSVYHEGGESPKMHLISDVGFHGSEGKPGLFERHHYEIPLTPGRPASYERFVHEGDSMAAKKGIGLHSYMKHGMLQSADDVAGHMSAMYRVRIPVDAPVHAVDTRGSEE